MQYLALATDYDGTIAHDGIAEASAIAALERLRSSGRAIILVTGRQLDDLLLCMPRMDLFNRVVAENGALLYHPATQATRMLARPTPGAFAACLREAGVSPLSAGRAILATTASNEAKVRAAIDKSGLGLQIILNKNSLMVLSAGIDKASGLRAALAELEISPDRTVAVGDAENDLPFLRLCGMTVAVANAVPMLKQAAALVTAGSRGAGVTELIDLWLTGGLAAWNPAAGAAEVPRAAEAGDAPHDSAPHDSAPLARAWRAR